MTTIDTRGGEAKADGAGSTDSGYAASPSNGNGSVELEPLANITLELVPPIGVGA